MITKKKQRRKLSIGEIARRGLLKTRAGASITNKGSVSRILRDYEHEVVQTPHGPSKKYTLDVIVKVNQKKK